MDFIINAKDNASKIISGVGESAEDSAERAEEAFDAFSLAISGAGIALEGLSRSQKDLNNELTIASSATGLNSGKVKDLAKQYSDASLSMNETVGLIKLAGQRGLTSSEEIGKFVDAHKDLKLATGENIDDLTEFNNAMSTVGIEANNVKDSFGAYGYVLNETKSGVSGFTDFIDATSVDMKKLNLDVDESAAMFGILQNELGMTKQTASSELPAAINESDGSLQGVLDTLNVSKETWEQYNGKVMDNAGVIEENAQKNAENVTFIEEMQSKVSDLTVEYNEEISALGDLSTVLIAVGPLMQGLSAAKGFMLSTTVASTAAIIGQTAVTWAQTVATWAQTAASWSLNTAMGLSTGIINGVRNSKIVFTAITWAQTAATWAQTAATWSLNTALAVLTSPITLVVAAIGALIGIGVLLYKNWETVAGFGKKVFGGLFDFLGDTIGEIGDLFVWLKDGWDDLWNGMSKGIKTPVNFIIGMINTLIEGMNNLQIKIPEWSPIAGGKEFGIDIPTIPQLHKGGTFRTPNVGGEGLALLKDREKVVAPGGMDDDEGGSSVSGMNQILHYLKKIYERLGEDKNFYLEGTFNLGSNKQFIQEVIKLSEKERSKRRGGS
ncbi:hypothetical protein [Pontibacillus yanchengensis]|nr:hypothetical protein [Pontibacillus yanchengensis]